MTTTGYASRAKRLGSDFNFSNEAQEMVDQIIASARSDPRFPHPQIISVSHDLLPQAGGESWLTILCVFTNESPS